MNQRIQQLAEQAKFMAEEDINRQISYNTELKAFAEKFAELIVQECITHLHQRGVEGFGILEERNLKEHFGVEE